MASRKSLADATNGVDIKPLLLSTPILPIYLNTAVESQVASTRVKALITELSTFKKDLEKAKGVLQEAVQDLCDCETGGGGGEEEEEEKEESEEIKQVDKEYKSVLDKVKELEIRIQALSTIRQQLAQGVQVKDINSLYESTSSKEIELYSQKTSRQKFGDDPDYTHFRSIIWEAFHEDEGMPDIKKFLPMEEGDEEDSDDEIEVGTIKEDFKCPLSLKHFVDPMSSTKCKHSYSRTYLLDYLRSAPQPIACPVMGCPALFSEQDLKLDEKLAQRTARHIKRLKEQGSDGKDKGKTFVEVEDSDEDEE